MKHPLRRFASSPSPAGRGRILWTGKAGSTVALTEHTRADADPSMAYCQHSL